MEKSVQSDIRGNNNSQLHMAISDFFHCYNIQDRSVESCRFLTLLAKALLFGNDFKCPNRRQVGGEFLDHKYGGCSYQNPILVGEYADIFGLS